MEVVLQVAVAVVLLVQLPLGIRDVGGQQAQGANNLANLYMQQGNNQANYYTQMGNVANQLGSNALLYSMLGGGGGG